ncbi:translation initiation factor IF-2 associated domain-containing protein, partial [Reyranella sp. CPCC 100927]|uniref:translation initiation factor IF-2 associated domain-containing protein n=1 Tax=Reyranella sp. CPCC 100927 TaxID=2599616 RepID=UPI0011B91039
MSESTETKQTKPLTLGGAGRLDLKPKVETGQVRQKFSHGRTKAVTVEVKKKRVVPPTGPVAHTPAPAPAVAKPVPPAAKPVEAPPPAPPAPPAPPVVAAPPPP